MNQFEQDHQKVFYLYAKSPVLDLDVRFKILWNFGGGGGSWTRRGVCFLPSIYLWRRSFARGVDWDIGQGSAGGPVKDEQLPSKMYVDYVRFFKFKERD